MYRKPTASEQYVRFFTFFTYGLISFNGLLKFVFSKDLKREII